MKIVETRDLTKRFGALTAVDALNISVEECEIFGLLGPNGAGKTTAIKMLNTLLPLSSGEAFIGGFDVRKRPGDVRRVIGYVPQLLSVDGTLTAYENLLISTKLYDVPRNERESRIRASLAWIGLEDVANKMVRTYSGGMIRRLEIAQAMLHRPRVLFLDEPTVGLDPLARKTVADHIQQLHHERGTTIVLTTHLMEEADDLCDRVAIMHHGKLAVIGTPAELKAACGGNGTTLEEVFLKCTGDNLESGVSYRETRRTRKVASRLG